MPTGGEVLVDILAQEGVLHVFTVPGESFIAVLDAMHSDTRVRPITCRHEGGAAMMAEATGKLTGRPGIAFVTRGPGATNAASGVYVAHQDTTPMIVFVGMPARALDGLPAFQAIDLTALFGGITKWVATVTSADKLPSVVGRAFRMACDGRCGPVIVGIPEDVLSETTSKPIYAVAESERRPPSEAALAKIRHALAYAERPLIVAGGSEWTAAAASDLAVFAERFDLPIVASFRRQDHLDNRHRCYVGHAGFAIDASLLAGLKAADLVIAIGARLGEITAQGFTVLNGKISGQSIIEISSDAGGPAGSLASTISVAASPTVSVSALATMSLPGKRPPWGIWRRDLRAAYEASLKPQPTPGDVKLERIIQILSETLPYDAIVCNGAGNYASFLQRYFVYKGYPSQLAPISGSMGYGLPAGIAAKLEKPDRTIVVLAGDGCLQMTGQELMTAVQFGLPLVVIVANNGALGTIRMHQERRYPGRVVATSLTNPDFVALAQSCGAYGERIATTDDFAPALLRALASQKPALLELALDTDAISPLDTITSIRAAASKRDTP
jgi:acetolactate synthase I/II/III large subunit